MAAALKTSYTIHETRDVKGAEDAHRRLLEYFEQEGYEPSKVVRIGNSNGLLDGLLAPPRRPRPPQPPPPAAPPCARLLRAAPRAAATRRRGPQHGGGRLWLVLDRRRRSSQPISSTRFLSRDVGGQKSVPPWPAAGRGMRHRGPLRYGARRIGNLNGLLTPPPRERPPAPPAGGHASPHLCTRPPRSPARERAPQLGRPATRPLPRRARGGWSHGPPAPLGRLAGS